MKERKVLLAITISAVLFTILFYRKSLGLNLFLFESFLISWLLFNKQVFFTTKIQILAVLGFIVTSVFTVITHSVFSYLVHFLALFVFIGVLDFPKSTSLISNLKIAFFSLFKSQNVFFKKTFNTKIKGKKLGGFFWKSRIFFIPLLIIGFFTIIYSASNPIFSELISEVTSFIQKGINFLFKDLELLVFITFFIGILISNFIFIRTSNKRILKSDSNASENLVRIKKKNIHQSGILSLKNEYKAAIFLLFTLNTILLILNSIDVYWVWFNFEWSGQHLKQFVHEGTYLLIFSIIISIVLILFYFRGNLNFYKKNKLLKALGYVWIIQNSILTISVGFRNFWYINYYSLAYKRIGVAIFLLLTLYGLFTVFVKIKETKSSFYLFKSNAFALYIVLVTSSIINWDSVIAKYNFSHFEKSYTHLNYLVTLSDKTLPYLDKTFLELSDIKNKQKDKFSALGYDISPAAYRKSIERRKKEFKNKWESKTILEWNLAEYLAYRKLYPF